MPWWHLLLAGLCEVLGVACMNLYARKKTVWRLLSMVGTFALSFRLLALAMRDIPMSTAYAVWTGLGVVGSVLAGMLFFNERADWRRLFFIGCILGGAVGLRLMS